MNDEERQSYTDDVVDLARGALYFVIAIAGAGIVASLFIFLV